MPRKVLSLEEVVTMLTLKEKGMSNKAIANLLGVTEGAVRYRLRRAENGQADGRCQKRAFAAEYDTEIRSWVRAQQQDPEAEADPQPHEIQVRALYDWLVSEHQYPASYRSVLRYVRKIFPKAKLRPFRRVEMPPGAQAQVDWFDAHVHLAGEGRCKLYGFIMTLSHSRKTAVVWRRGMNQLHWHAAHNEAFRRPGGVPAVVRIGNCRRLSLIWSPDSNSLDQRAPENHQQDVVTNSWPFTI